jgi:hypothetical protein
MVCDEAAPEIVSAKIKGRGQRRSTNVSDASRRCGQSVLYLLNLVSAHGRWTECGVQSVVPKEEDVAWDLSSSVSPSLSFDGENALAR